MIYTYQKFAEGRWVVGFHNFSGQWENANKNIYSDPAEAAKAASALNRNLDFLKKIALRAAWIFVASLLIYPVAGYIAEIAGASAPCIYTIIGTVGIFSFLKKPRRVRRERKGK